MERPNNQTQITLDRAGCDCGHDDSVLHIHSRCHPRYGLHALYEKGTGLLHLFCARCESRVVTIVVANE